MRVLMITSEWPTPEHPTRVPFIARQVDFLRRAGVDVEVFHFRGAKKLPNYLRAWGRVQRRLRTENFDLVHAQWGQSAVPALPKRRPLVITFRGNDLEGIVGRGGRYTMIGRVQTAASHWAARYADEVIVVSESLGRRLRRSYQVIPSGLDMERFHPMPMREARERLGLSLDRPLVLFAASPTEERKRYGLARTAVEMIQDRHNADLIVAYGVGHAEVPVYMNACDCLLLTSLHEGSPNVVKEALACNLPVVSVDIGDVRERIGAVEGCVVCVDDTPQTIAAGLDSVLAKKQRVNGVAAIRDLDEHEITAKVIQVYERAVSRVRSK